MSFLSFSVTPHDLWDLGFPIRDQTCTCYSGKGQSSALDLRKSQLWCDGRKGCHFASDNGSEPAVIVCANSHVSINVASDGDLGVYP